jgi:hypothetical protein
MRAGNGRKPETLCGLECICSTRKYCTAEEASLTIARPKRQGISKIFTQPAASDRSHILSQKSEYRSNQSKKPRDLIPWALREIKL